MIVKFRTKSCFYIYDVFTNSLLRVTEPVYNIIDNKIFSSDVNTKNQLKYHYRENDIRDAINSIGSMRKLGYFAERASISFKLPFTEDEVIDALDNNLINVILEVTQQCNLRCGYCPYSGLANRLRPHNPTHMTYSVAKRAIDYYFRHSCDTKLKVITFYGGEPLLNFKLIEKCVLYAKAMDKNVQFAITTNGVLLNKEIILFLEKNSFIVTLSIDGPKALHDRFRVDLSGRGSFNRCWENFRLLYSVFSNPRRININVSIGPGEYLSEQYRFLNSFSKNYDCTINPTRLSFDDANVSAKNMKRIFYSKRTYYEIRRLRRKYLHLLKRGSNADFLMKMFAKDLRFIHNRKEDVASEYVLRPNGICIPGWEKLFVDAKGYFYMCEKMTDYVEIGSVYSGLNHSRILEILKQYINFCNDECKTCWCMHLCRSCFINAKEGREIRIEVRRHYCQEYREYIKKEVLTYLNIIEKNPKAFSFLEKEQQVSYFDQRLIQMKEKREPAVIG